MSMWEPFSRPARQAIVRSQEVAVMFGAHFIATDHMTFALAEADDPVGHALVTHVDRDALRERLGVLSSAPGGEMVFTAGAKQSIELAFENARRLNHDFIGTAHIALGILSSVDPPPLLAGKSVDELRASLDLAAARDSVSRPPVGKGLAAPYPWTTGWKQTQGESVPHQAAAAILSVLSYFEDLGKPGARVSITVAVPDEAERTWTWLNEPEQRS